MAAFFMEILVSQTMKVKQSTLTCEMPDFPSSRV